MDTDTDLTSQLLVFAIGRGDQTGSRLLGSAFAVGPNRLATAYHVVAPNDDKLFMVTPKVQSLADYQDTSDTEANIMPVAIVAADPMRDLCILEFDATLGRIESKNTIGGTDLAPTGVPVVTLGFPHLNTGRMVLTQQIANVGARILIANGTMKSKHLVLNTQAREGQSGGPVFLAGTNTIVAVLVGSFAPGGGGAISLGGIDPATLHQTTHAVSAEYLKAML